MRRSGHLPELRQPELRPGHSTPRRSRGLRL